MYERKPKPQGFLTEDINLFIQLRKAQNKWNPHSEGNLIRFERYCYTFEDEVHSWLTQEMIDTWCAQRKKEKPSSCYTRTLPVVKFLEFLKERGRLNCQLPIQPAFSKSNFIPHFFTEEELQALFHALNNLPVTKENKCSFYRWLTAPVFFSLMFSTGMRPVEVRNLKRKNINRTDGVISIEVTKGINHRYVVVDEEMLELLMDFDAKMDQLEPNRAFFFPSPRGGGYSRDWVDDTFDIARKAAGIPDARAYDLRHHYAITNINNWINMGIKGEKLLVYLMLSMGHSSLDETKYYYHYVPELAEIVNEIEEKGLGFVIPEADYDWQDYE